MNKSDRGSLFTVFLVVLVDLLGFGIVLPLLPYFASRFEVSAFSIGLLYSVYSLAQLIFSPIWGRFSDRVGRRPVMLASTLGAAFSYVLFAFAQDFTMLFLSRMMAGIMGGNISTAQAYVADVTSKEERAKGMGFLGAAFGIGFTLGPAFASLFISDRFAQIVGSAWVPAAWSGMLAEHRYALPGLFAASLSLLSFVLILFKLPETVGRAQVRDEARITRPSVFSADFWAGFKHPGAGSGHALPLLLLAMFLLAFGHSSLYSAFPLFCQRQLHLSAGQVGLQFAVMGIITVIIQGGMIRQLVKRFGERDLFYVGSFLLAAGLGLLPMGHDALTTGAYLGLLAVGAGLCGPTVTSLVSKEAESAHIGAMMGIAQGMSALGRVIGPAWGGFLYGLDPRWPFWLTSGTMAALIWIGSDIRRRRRN